jgi:Spy/CpxP family protein refolding chaperone
MNSLGRWRIIALLAGIFLAGAAAGSVVTFRLAQREVRQRTNPESWVDATLRRWDRRLHLTNQQREQIRPILEDVVHEMRELRRRDLAETDALVNRAQINIEPQLDAKQRATLHKMQEQRRRRIERANAIAEQH